METIPTIVVRKEQKSVALLENYLDLCKYHFLGKEKKDNIIALKEIKLKNFSPK